MVALKKEDLTPDLERIAERVLKGEKFLIRGSGNKNVVIMTEKEYNKIVGAKTKSQQQGEALDKLLMALDTIDDEPFDEFDKILAQGISVRDVKL